MPAAALPKPLTARQRAALPGARIDGIMGALKWALPGAAVALTLAIIILPLTKVREFSFLLAKDQVGMATERLRVDRARYRGEAARGEPFEISAASAVQRSSAVREVEMRGLVARLQGQDGPATVTAPTARYYLDSDLLRVNGPVELRSVSGYSLDSRDVAVDLARRQVVAHDGVRGQLPIGSFRADRLDGDLAGRRVVLDGHVHLRINGKRGTGRP